MTHLTDERAQELLDGTLPEDVQRRCELHVSRCDDCRAVVESFRALSAALDGLEAPLPPPDFTFAVMARIDEAERARAAERRIAAGIAAAVAVLAAVCIVAAGAGAWAPALAGLFDRLGGAVTTLVIAGDVLAPIVSALRLQIVVACVVFAVPLLYGLSRLVPSRVEVNA
jgi:anti-sigma factor RsiW